MRELAPAERAAVGLLASACGGGDVPEIPRELWPEVLRELKAHTVQGLVADRVGELGLSDDQLDGYLGVAMTQVGRWHRLMGAQEKVLGMFREAGIPVAILKGAGAAASYPYPDRRAMGDVDLLVRPCDFERAYGMLEADGWECKVPLEQYGRHAGMFKKGFPEVELHQYFSMNPRVPSNRALDDLLYDAVDRASLVDVGGYDVPLFPTLENGIVLLEHINHHLSNGLGLRQIIDWHFYVERHLDDALWEGGFRDAARAAGLERLAVTSAALCKRHLGLERNAQWFAEADLDLVDELLAYVVDQGNFGKKTEHDTRATKIVLRNLRSPAALVKYLYAGGKAHWAPARRHKWLAPAACLYQVGHVARKGLARQAPLESLAEESRQSREETAFLRRLGVLRD